MAGKSPIEWTEHTWNPIVGCSIVSPGCTNCYAMKMAGRIEKMKPSHYDGTTKATKAGAVWTGKLALAPEHILLEPLRRKKPTVYFVNSMGDLFHEDAPDEWIDRVFAVMALCPQHTFQVLTKRADRMREYCNSLGRNHDVDRVSIAMKRLHAETGYGANGAWYTLGPQGGWYFKNVWLGVSTERQQEADERIPLLLQTPAAIRFISAEPLLGPIDLSMHLGIAPNHDDLRGLLNWVIVGGESGPNARPMNPKWARSLRDQCADAGAPFFFKQWGEFAPLDTFSDAEPDAHVYRVGKKKAGRLLDGKEHNGFPLQSRAAAA